jgi:hypothetical protein
LWSDRRSRDYGVGASGGDYPEEFDGDGKISGPRVCVRCGFFTATSRCERRGEGHFLDRAQAHEGEAVVEAADLFPERVIRAVHRLHDARGQGGVLQDLFVKPRGVATGFIGHPDDPDGVVR